MRGPLIVVTGTGTSVGKTHLAESLLLAWRRNGRRVGIKPVESGVRRDAESESDGARLQAASSFHVKHAAYRLSAPLAPHLAARDQGIVIVLDVITEMVDAARAQADGVVVELPGGLFTPLTDDACNVDLAAALAPDLLLLVAPDRLGALHDVVAATRAASASSVRVDGIVLIAPEHRDASTGRNAAELARFASAPVLAVLPRASPAELSELASLRKLLPAR